MSEMRQSIAALLELRLRYRRNPEARALVDKALSLVARARDADEATSAALQIEAQSIADTLALRFGSPSSLTRH